MLLISLVGYAVANNLTDGIYQSSDPTESTQQYVVKRGDILSQLGFKLRPDKGVSGAQMSVALYRYNPEAFVDREIDQLKVNSRLSIPTRAQILQISYPQALNIIKGYGDAKQLLPQPLSTVTTETANAAITEADVANDDSVNLAITIAELQSKLKEQYNSTHEVTQQVKSSVNVINAMHMHVSQQDSTIKGMRQTLDNLTQQQAQAIAVNHELEPNVDIPLPSDSVQQGETLTERPVALASINRLNEMVIGIFATMALLITIFIFKRKRAKKVAKKASFSGIDVDDLMNISFDDVIDNK